MIANARASAAAPPCGSHQAGRARHLRMPSSTTRPWRWPRRRADHAEYARREQARPAYGAAIGAAPERRGARCVVCTVALATAGRFAGTPWVLFAVRPVRTGKGPAHRRCRGLRRQLRACPPARTGRGDGGPPARSAWLSRSALAPDPVAKRACIAQCEMQHCRRHHRATWSCRGTHGHASHQ